MLDNPLHDTKIVQHLYERDEEEDRAKLVVGTSHQLEASDREPDRTVLIKKPMVVNRVLVEKEEFPSNSLTEEISSQGCDPVEYGESGACLENEQRNSLLKEETYYNRWPDSESGCILRERIFQLTKVFRLDC